MKFLICNVVCANLMKSPGHKGELYTQVLRGDRMMLLDQYGSQWLYVELTDHHTRGWILKSQCKQLDEASFRAPEKYIVYGNHSGLKIGNQQLDCLHGTFLDVGTVMDAGRPQIVWDLESIRFDTQSKEKILDFFLEAPYMWGGTTHLGIDCSGLSRMFYRFYGIALPHLASVQMNFGVEISTLEDVQFGDLAFFKNDAGEIHHVGIMRNTGEIVHASESNGAVVKDVVERNGVVQNQIGAFSRKIYCVKRIFKDEN